MKRRDNKRTFRLTMLGLLCGGLLLTGIGAGIQLVEASTLTYGGEQVVPGKPQQLHAVVDLDESAETVSIFSHSPDLGQDLRDLGVIEVRNTVTPGTLELDFRYDSTSMELQFWSDCQSAQQEVSLYWTNRSDLAVLLDFKDQLLADLQSGQLHDYVFYQLTDAVISVHPDDAQRVQIQ